MRKSARENGILPSINQYRSEIMGFAALWILLYHEWQLVSVEWSAAYYAERFVKDIGFIGVDMFLLLSGMGSSYAIEKYPLGVFYQRRFKRLILPTVTAAVLRLFVSRWNMRWFIKCLVGYNFLTGSTTAFLWYIYAAALFYLLFPLYWHYFKKSGNKIAFFLSCLAAWYLLFGVLMKNVFSDTSWLVINRVPVFLLGVLFGWKEREGKAAKPGAWLAVSVPTLIAGLAAEYYCSVYGAKLIMPMPTVFLPALAVGVSLVILLAALFAVIGKNSRFLRFFGSISLELYCLQEVMGDWLLPRLSAHLPAPAVNALFAPIVIASAFFLHKASEKIRE